MRDSGPGDYCESEKYDMADTWTAPDFGPPEPAHMLQHCDHESWHSYVSRGVESCTQCGLERKIDDTAKQIKHTRKSGC